MAEPLSPTTVEALAERFSTFLVDQFGVLLDGKKPYPGAAAALKHLKDRGKTVIILSNSGRAGDYNAERLAKLGLAPTLYDTMVTSGDVAFHLVSSGKTGFPTAPGTRCLTISSGNDTNLAQRLNFRDVTSPNDAEVLVISGSLGNPLPTYADALRPAAERQVPAVCTNPDIHMLTGAGTAPGAGAIARLYEDLGGRVVWVGKPHPEIYDYALRVAGTPPKANVVMIGDSIDHDILGAAGSGLSAALVRTGVHADLTTGQLAEKIEALGVPAPFILPSFQLG